jgi:hypothetical protein
MVSIAPRSTLHRHLYRNYTECSRQQRPKQGFYFIIAAANRVSVVDAQFVGSADVIV